MDLQDDRLPLWSPPPYVDFGMDDGMEPLFDLPAAEQAPQGSRLVEITATSTDQGPSRTVMSIETGPRLAGFAFELMLARCLDMPGAEIVARRA